jgi:hypothetical protein
MSSHFARAAGSETRAFRKSAGTVWTTPVESFSATPLPYTRCPPAQDVVGRREVSRHAGAFQDLLEVK